MEAIQPFLGWLHQHLFGVVFVASLIDATGVPFPGRAILVAAGIFAPDSRDVVLLILTSVLGSLAGDHILYAAGMRGGYGILALYCRLTLGSVRCVETTLAYFRRFGAMALLVCRFSTGVRLFAAILAGSGHIGYGRFIALDLIGTTAYTTLWIVLGATFGAAILDRVGGFGRFLLLLGPVALLGVLVYRLFRRRRYGRASHDLFSPP
jgi:membrane protein DedA with SNARE-associated domain